MTETYLAFHELTIVDEGDDSIVGRPATESYGIFPKSGVALLRKLQDGMSVSAAAHWYETHEGDTVDMVDFVDTLRELGFIRDQSNEPDPAPAAPVTLSWLGRAIFSPVALVCYVLLGVGAAWVFVRVPEIRPAPRNIFFTNSLLAIEITLLVGGTIGMGIHEGFHVLAGRRIGLPSRLGIGARLYFLVFETSLPGLLGVPRRRRYLPFLAGMLADAVLFSLLTLLAAAAREPSGAMPWPGRLALALAYLTMLRFAWQFYFFLRTDLYYVITTLLGCSDLHGATRARLHNLARRVVFRSRPRVDESAWTDRDRRMVAWYAPIFVGGVITLLGVAVFAVAPAVVLALTRVVDGLLSGGARPRFWDAIGFLVFGQAPITTALVINLRNRFARRRTRGSTPDLPISAAQEGRP